MRHVSKATNKAMTKAATKVRYVANLNRPAPVSWPCGPPRRPKAYPHPQKADLARRPTLPHRNFLALHVSISFVIFVKPSPRASRPTGPVCIGRMPLGLKPFALRLPFSSANTKSPRTGGGLKETIMKVLHYSKEPPRGK
jgi:hypothetical protein